MNYYEILEISKSATLEVIKAAYKAQISKYHPDNLETGDLKKAQQINEAYEVLSDPVKRAEYDKKIALDEGNDIKNGDEKETTKYKDTPTDNEKSSDEENKDSEKTDIVEETKDLGNSDSETKEENLKSLGVFFSLPVLYISLVVFFPVTIVLFIWRCYRFIRYKNIKKRKRHIVWTVVFIITAMLFVAYALDSDEGEKVNVVNEETTIAESINSEKEKSETKNLSTEISTTEITTISSKNKGENKNKKQTEDENKNEIAIEKIPEYSDVVNSTAKYSYYENPYYTHALKRYVDFVNKAYKNGGGSQQITITTLDDLFKEAGISKQLRKKIIDSEGVNVLKDENYVRVDIKEKSGLITSLMDGEMERLYFEVSDKAKDSESLLGNKVYFYTGKLKDSLPEGNGAIFVKDGFGLRLFYVGKFKKGQFSGKGILMSSEEGFGNSLFDGKSIGYTPFDITIGNVVTCISKNYKRNLKNGKSTIYQSDINELYNSYNLDYSSYCENYLSKYDEEKARTAKSKWIKESATSELELIMAGDLKSTNSYEIHVKYPVIKPIIKYQGNMKNDKYNGKGVLYTGIGAKWYEGKFKKDEMNGKGTIYSANTEEKLFEGTFKNYDVIEGTLYNSDGTVRKKGKFDDLAITDSQIKTAENIDILYAYRVLLIKYGEKGLMEKVSEDGKSILAY